MTAPKDLKFLILDDMSTIRQMLKEHLKEQGFTGVPLEAETVGEALEKAMQSISSPQPLQFILSDWNLPDDIGLNFLKKIRADQRFNQVPFLMVTTENEISFMIEAVNAGCTNYMVKPWTKEDLLDKINSCWSMLNKVTKKPMPVKSETLIEKNLSDKNLSDKNKPIAQPVNVRPASLNQTKSLNQEAKVKTQTIIQAKAKAQVVKGKKEEKKSDTSFWEKITSFFHKK